MLLSGCTEPDPPLASSYRVTLQAEGGELPFRMDLVESGEGSGDFDAFIHNGEEVVRVPDVTVSRSPLTVRVRFEQYDSTLTLAADRKNGGLSGAWVKPRPEGEIATLLARATSEDAGVRFEPHPSGGVNAAAFEGRWRIEFLRGQGAPAGEGGAAARPDPPGVGVFEVGPDGSATGTIMTSTGDYRYLAGRADVHTLRLSTFDGGHAILVRASLQDDGTLLGDTSWGNWAIETWAAARDQDAALPEPVSLASVTTGATIAEVALRTPDGAETTLREAVDALGARATVVFVFGTWCPNSADLTADLAAVVERYRDDGLGVIGLAYELTGDAARGARRIGAYRGVHGVDWPIYLAGESDKEKAGATLPIIDRVHAFPTLIFLDASGEPVSVLTGYTGPAAGAEHERFVAEMESRIRALLGE